MAEQQPGSTAFHLEQRARVGKIDIRGNVADRDVVLGPTAADAEAAQSRHQLLATLLKLPEHVLRWSKRRRGSKAT